MSVDIGIAAAAGIGIGGNAAAPVMSGSDGAAGRISTMASRPATVVASYQASSTQPTYGFLVFPQVTPGKIWVICRIGVSGNDPFTVIAGASALAYRSATIPQDSSVEPATFGDLLGVIGQIPNTYYPPTTNIYARGNERVVVAMRGLPNGQQIQGSMDIIEHDLNCFLANLLKAGG